MAEKITVQDTLVARLMEDFNMQPADADRVVKDFREHSKAIKLWDRDADTIPDKIMDSMYQLVRMHRKLLSSQ